MATLRISPPLTTPLSLFAQVQVGHPTGVGDNKRVLPTSLKKHPWLTPPQGVGVDEEVVDAVEVVAVPVVASSTTGAFTRSRTGRDAGDRGGTQ